MTMTEDRQIKWDGMPKPPSLKDRISALKKDEEVMAFLRELRMTTYYFVAERTEGEPITGGGWEKFNEVKSDCEMILQMGGQFANVHRVTITDALGAVVWSKERAQVDEAVTSSPPSA